MDSRKRESSAAAAAATINLDLNIDLISVLPTPTTADEYDHHHLWNELSRMNAEHDKLLEKLSLICKDQVNLQQQLFNLIQHQITSTNFFKKPRSESHTLVTKISRQIHPSDTTLIVKDGYQWRKYGQKVTRDNPSPRAYYKCSFSPNCPVKKKVQKSVDDPSLLEAIYEGEHNHPPSAGETIVEVNEQILVDNENLKDAHEKFSLGVELPFEKFLIEHMTSSLVHNSSFTSTLATLIIKKMLDN